MKEKNYSRWVRRLFDRLSGRSERLLKEQWMARVEAHNKTGAELTALREQLPRLLNALDTCTFALAQHGHEWADWERACYKQAVEFIERESPRTDSLREKLERQGVKMPPESVWFG